MRTIAIILAIVGIFSSMPVLASSQASNRRGSTSRGEALENHHGSFVSGAGENHRYQHFARRAELEERSEDHQEMLEKRLGALFAGKALLKAGMFVGKQIYNHRHHRRSADELLEKRSEDHQEMLEKRLGALFAGKALLKAGMFVGKQIYNHRHHRRSADELLEERSRLLELRDQLADTRYSARSDEPELEGRALPYDIAKQFANRWVNHHLELNGRELAEEHI